MLWCFSASIKILDEWLQVLDFYGVLEFSFCNWSVSLVCQGFVTFATCSTPSCLSSCGVCSLPTPTLPATRGSSSWVSSLNSFVSSGSQARCRGARRCGQLLLSYTTADTGACTLILLCCSCSVERPSSVFWFFVSVHLTFARKLVACCTVFRAEQTEKFISVLLPVKCSYGVLQLVVWLTLLNESTVLCWRVSYNILTSLQERQKANF